MGSGGGSYVGSGEGGIDVGSGEGGSDVGSGDDSGRSGNLAVFCMFSRPHV